jgi:hypothetical protein
VLVGFALLQVRSSDRILLFSLLVPLFLLLHDQANPNHYTIWTPYQQIDYSRSYAANGDYLSGHVLVNHVGYKSIVDLSEVFLARHPHLLKESPDENPYNLPFRFAEPSPEVMIVGAGTGNDVAASLRHESSSVDAVEIDPAILALGKREHPERPYDSPYSFRFVFQNRLKIAGGWWKMENLKKMIALRVLRANGCWADHWSHVHQQAA